MFRWNRLHLRGRIPFQSRRAPVISLLSSLLLASVLAGTGATAEASSTSQCASAVVAPWISASSPEPDLAEAKRDFLHEALPPIDSQVSDSWLSDEGGQTVLNIGVKLPGPKDTATIEQALAANPQMTMPVHIVSVPYSATELDAFQETIAKYASANDLVLSSGVRPDIGRIEVTVSSTLVDSVATDLASLLPPCTVDVSAGDPLVYANYTRQDMPPVKGGKIEEMHAYGFVAICTVGFVFELDGSGQQPLRGGTAGHCTQGIVSVFDGQNDKVGDTVSPNLLRQTGPPAVADGVLWDPNVSRSNIENYVIETTDSQVRVDAGYTKSDVSVGDTVCRTGKSSGTDCGRLLDKDFDYTLQYPNFQTGETVQKQVQNGMVAAPNSSEGDSGGPIWVPLMGPPPRCAALGITSGKQSDGDVVFTLTNVIAGHTSSHVWTGD
jgi:hypothetical protein